MKVSLKHALHLISGMQICHFPVPESASCHLLWKDKSCLLCILPDLSCKQGSFCNFSLHFMMFVDAAQVAVRKKRISECHGEWLLSSLPLSPVSCYLKWEIITLKLQNCRNTFVHLNLTGYGKSGKSVSGTACKLIFVEHSSVCDFFVWNSSVRGLNWDKPYLLYCRYWWSWHGELLIVLFMHILSSYCLDGVRYRCPKNDSCLEGGGEITKEELNWIFWYFA